MKFIAITIAAFLAALCMGLVIAKRSNLTFVIPREINGKPVRELTVEFLNGFPNAKLAKKIVIPNSVTSIGDLAFAGCENLTSVEIPNSVTSIEENAFYGCKSLTSVKIPDSVTSIGEFAFRGCENLTSVEIPNSITHIEFFAFPSSCRVVRRQSSLGKKDSMTFVIPHEIDGKPVRELTVEFFNGSPNAKWAEKIVIPDSVTSIGDLAFAGCESLTSVEIPDSVTSIGDYAFSGCNKLKTIEASSSNVNFQTIDGVLFTKDGKTLLAVPGGKKGKYAVPNSVTSIGEGAFQNCKSLTSVEIPDSVTSIGDYAFSGCNKLKTIEASSSNVNFQTIDGVLFTKDGKTLLAVPGGKEGKYAVPNSVTSIGNAAFGGCASLISVEIPDSVTSIGDLAFELCGSLTSVVIPESVTSVGEGAFRWCKSLTSVEIPESVTFIGDKTFSACPKLKTIEVSHSNANFQTIDGVLFTKDGQTLLAVPGGRRGKYVVPDSVTCIGHCAFYCCESLTNVEISESVISIEDFAFYGCTRLTTAEIPETTEVGDYAFPESCRVVRRQPSR